MPTYKDIPQCLKDIEGRIKGNKKAIKKLAKYNGPIQMTFVDTGRKVLMVVTGEQGFEIKDNTGDDNAVVKIEFIAEQVMVDIFNKETGVIKAKASGKISVIEGQMRSLIKLRGLLF